MGSRTPRYHDPRTDTWHEPFYVCPPEWDLTPTEYAAIERAEDRDQLLPYGLMAGGGLTFTAGYLALPTHDHQIDGISGAWSVWLMVIAAVIAMATTALYLRVRWARQRLSLPVVDPSRGPQHVDQMINLTRSTDEEREPVVRFLAEATHAESAEARAGALEAAWAAAKAAETQMRERLAILPPPPRRTRPTTPQDPPLTGSDPGGLIARQWDLALRRYDKVLDEWGAIASDPLSALDHAALLDVSQPRTAAFIEALGRAQDRIAVLTGPDGVEAPTSETVIAGFEDLVRAVTTTWEQARRHAARAGYDWLPPAERDLARRAAGLLATAADEGAPVAERALAAEKAAAVLRRIETIILPDQAAEAIAATSRLALEAAPAPTAGSVLTGHVPERTTEREAR